MDKKLFDILDTRSNSALLAEISETARMVAADFDLNQFISVYDDIAAIYQGHCPGYKACNTDYHDLNHVLQVTLATASIAHGTHVAGRLLDRYDLLLLLVLAMLHDTGYIQSSSDEQGTGAKYTLVHVDRSIDFANHYLPRIGFDRDAVLASAVIIKATDISVRIDEIPFLREKWELLAKIMATGDIVAQISDRFYLEKLLFLYREFAEGGVPGFDSELDLLKKTIGFYNFALKRMDHDLGGFRKHLKLHFKKRWGINEDLYQKSVDANIRYLTFLLAENTENYRGMLQRGAIVKKLQSVENE
jgi:HD superfamily phosphodiesterase